MERYLVIKEVGYGAFGNVWRAVNKETGEIVAIKKMKKKYYSWDECLNLREVKSLRKMNHPNIVMLKEVIRENDELYFIFEYMECNLYEVMKARNEPFSESEIRNWCFQVFQALSYMHRNGYFHRDLKPENLLVSKDVIKVADFGLAREISSKPPFTEYVSTRWYRAPEVLLQSSAYGPAVDLWAMGAIMAELFSLRPLFPGINEADEIDKICSVIGSPCQCSWGDGLCLADTIRFRFPQYPGIHLSMLVPSASEYAISLISSLCSWDPHRRPTAAKALQHPFFQPCYYIPPSLRSRDTGISKTPPTAGGMKGALDHHSARRFSVGPVPNHKSGSNFCSSTTYSSLRTGGEQGKLDMHPYQDYGSGERFEQNSLVQPLYRPPARRNNPAGQGGITNGSRAFEQLVHLPTISSYRVAGMEELLANLTLNSGSQPPKRTPPSIKAGSWHSHAEYLNGSCGGYPRKVVG